MYSTINTYLNLWPPVHWFFIAFHHPIMVQQSLNCDPAFWIRLWKSNEYCLWLKSGYSKISNNGPYQKQTTSGQWEGCLHPFDFTIELIHLEPPRSGHLSTLYNRHISPRLTLANTKLPSKTDSETMPTDVFAHNGDACWPFRKIVCHSRWIQRLGIILAPLLIMLAFSSSYGEVRNGDLIVYALPHLLRAIKAWDLIFT